MAQKIIGLDLGTHGVKIVLISAGLRALQVLDVHEEAVVLGPDGDDSIEAAIEVAVSVLKRRGWSHYPVGVVLPGGIGSYRVLRFPFGDARRIAQAISFEVDGQFPVPVEELDIDHLVVTGTKNAGQALVVAVRKEVNRRVSDSLKAAKIDVKTVTVPPLALGQVLDMPAPGTDPAAAEGRVPVALIVDVGHRNSELVALGPKGPVAARSLRRGGYHVTRAIARAYSIEPDEAEALKHTGGILPHEGADLDAEQARLAAVVAKALEPLIREIEHTRLWLRTELGCEVTVLRISGGAAALSGFREYIGGQTGVPVEAAMPRESSTLKKVEGRDWSRATAALGAAVAAARRPLIQLYSDATSGAGEGSWLVDKASTFAVIGLAILAFGALDTVAKLQAYEIEEEVYANELAEATSSVFGEEVLEVTELEIRLRKVEGRDVTSHVQTRSSIDVMTALFKAAAPSGERPPPPPLPGSPEEAAAAAAAAAAGASRGTLMADGASAPNPSAPPGATMSTDGATSTSTPTPVSDSNAGINWEDELVFVAFEVRQRKIDLTASATRLSAQSRLKRRFQMLSCVSNVQEGKARDSNGRKVFEMSIEHNCLFDPLEEDA